MEGLLGFFTGVSVMMWLAYGDRIAPWLRKP
jgi:hypothetical protein